MIVLFGIFVRFNPEANVADWEKEKQQRNVSDIENEFYFRYPCEYNYTRQQASLVFLWHTFCVALFLCRVPNGRKSYLKIIKAAQSSRLMLIICSSIVSLSLG